MNNNAELGMSDAELASTALGAMNAGVDPTDEKIRRSAFMDVRHHQGAAGGLSPAQVTALMELSLRSRTAPPGSSFRDPAEVERIRARISASPEDAEAIVRNRLLRNIH